MDDDNVLDEAFIPMFMHIREMTDIQDATFMDEETGFKLELEEVCSDMPIELDVKVDENGKVSLGSVPPLYAINTSLQPVYHQMRITVVEKKE